MIEDLDGVDARQSKEPSLTLGAAPSESEQVPFVTLECQAKRLNDNIRASVHEPGFAGLPHSRGNFCQRRRVVGRNEPMGWLHEQPVANGSGRSFRRRLHRRQQRSVSGSCVEPELVGYRRHDCEQHTTCLGCVEPRETGEAVRRIDTDPTVASDHRADRDSSCAQRLHVAVDGAHRDLEGGR